MKPTKTQTDSAIQVLLDYSELLSKQQWNHSPEGRVFKVKFDNAVLILSAAVQKGNLRPLPRGTVIDYMGEQSTVIEDIGARTIKVWCGEDEQNWAWEFEGRECTVIGFDHNF